MSEETYQRPVPTKTVVTPPITEPFKPEPPEPFSRKTAQELAELVPQMAPFPPPRRPLEPTLTQEIKNRGYKNFEVDLSTAHTNLPIGLRGLGIVADTMTIIRADSAFTYRLNSASNDETPAEKGLEEDLFEIEEIYVTNSALSGKGIIRVTWNPSLIRVK